MSSLRLQVVSTTEERLVEIWDGEVNVAVVSGTRENPRLELYGMATGQPWRGDLDELAAVLIRARGRLPSEAARSPTDH